MKLYEQVYEGTRPRNAMYLLFQGYRTFRYPICTAIYCNVPCCRHLRIVNEVLCLNVQYMHERLSDAGNSEPEYLPMSHEAWAEYDAQL